MGLYRNDAALSLSDLNEEVYVSKNKRLTDEEVQTGLLYAYACWYEDNKHDPLIDTRRFTIKDYNEYKLDEHPSYMAIIRLFGTWKEAVKSIPDDHLHVGTHEHRAAYQKHFSKVIKDIMELKNTNSIGKVSTRDYLKYKRLHPDVLDWRVVALHVVPGDMRWNSLINAIRRDNI